MIQEPLFYVLAVIAILIISISKSGFGSGIGVLSVPLMALVVPPARAAAILLPLLCAMDIFNLYHYRKKFDRKNLAMLIPFALMGILIGTFTFRYFSDAQIRILIGFILVAFVATYALNLRHRGDVKEPNLVRSGLLGTIAGFTSFGVHGSGPIVGMILLPQRLEKSVYVGTTVVYFAIVNYTKLIPYYFLGQLNFDNLLASLILAPIVPLGLWIGLQLHKRVNEKYFYNLAYIFLLITGIKLLYDGISTL